MLVSPLRATRTLPAASTSAVPGSLEANRVSQVTSRELPSLNSARTVSWTSSPGLAVRSPGWISSLATTGSSFNGPGIPARIQLSKTWYGRLPTSKTLPPSCGARPDGLRSSRLSSGTSVQMRRPLNSRVRYW